MEFTIRGRIVPYVRMTQRSKWTDPRAVAYLDSQKSIRWQLQQQMVEHAWEMLPTQTSLGIEMDFDIGKQMHKCDWDNMVKAVQDAAQGIVFANDCWIDEAHMYRRLIDHLVEDVAILTVTTL